MSDRCNFYFGLFFALPPPSPELFFALLACVPKIIIRCMVPEIWCAVDGRTEKVKEMGAPPNDCLRKTQQKDSS